MANLTIPTDAHAAVTGTGDVIITNDSGAWIVAIPWIVACEIAVKVDLYHQSVDHDLAELSSR